MTSTNMAGMETAIEHSTAESPFPNENAAPVTEQQAHPATEGSIKHFKEIALDVRFSSEPEKIFKLVYKNEGFQRKTFDAQKLTDINIGSWVPADKPGLEKRQFSYVKPLSGSVGPSSTTCHITDEEVGKDPDKAYEVYTVTKTPDVPSGGSFEVQTRTCLTWAGGAKGGCRMVSSTEVVWSGRSMLKGLPNTPQALSRIQLILQIPSGIITSASLAGQRDCNKELAKAIRAHIAANSAEFGSSDVTSPEADDELGPGAQPDDGILVAGDGTESKAAGAQLGPGHAFLGPVRSTFHAGNAATSILALSNIVLLVLFLTTWMSGGNKVRVNKVVMSSTQEVAALQRIETLEAAWGSFKHCVDALAAETA